VRDGDSKKTYLSVPETNGVAERAVCREKRRGKEETGADQILSEGESCEKFEHRVELLWGAPPPLHVELPSNRLSLRYICQFLVEVPEWRFTMLFLGREIGGVNPRFGRT